MQGGFAIEGQLSVGLNERKHIEGSAAGTLFSTAYLPMFSTSKQTSLSH
jgi:hypothetical protein